MTHSQATRPNLRSFLVASALLFSLSAANVSAQTFSKHHKTQIAGLESFSDPLLDRLRFEETTERQQTAQLASKSAVYPPVNTADSLALVALFNSTNGSGWDDNSDWLTTEPVASWYGITVQDNRVTRISLDGNGLTGTIPAAIGNLTALTSLVLGIDLFGDGENRITGTIPSEIGNLRELERLWLDGNQLTGPIPPSIGNLTKLETLDFGNFFGGNLLSGPIPASIGNLTLLTNLRLSSNRLSGEIPPSIGNLVNLEELQVDDNQLTGSIPSQIGNLARLEVFNTGTFFGGNMLSGPIPPSIFGLTSLESLTLSQNQFEGPLPPEIGRLTAMESLSLSGNRLTGNIPPELGNLTLLEYLGLGIYLAGALEDGTPLVISSPNQFTGEIPETLSNLQNLESLLIANNAFTGAVPASLNNLPALSTLMLNCNQFDALPAFSPSDEFSALYADNNRFTFGDVEPNVGVPSGTYTYAPQSPVEVTETPSGGDIVLSVEDDSPNNSYQWFLNGSPVSGATDASLTISASDPNGPDAYHIEITNSVASELTLTSLPVLSGLVVNDPGDASDAQPSDAVCDVDPQTPGMQCTLRAAIETLSNANAQSCGTSALEITFAGVDLIQPGSALPPITRSVVVNGGSGGARVEINGAGAGFFADGLTLAGPDVTLRGLVINGFDGWGIRVTGGGGHTIENSRIGVLADEMPNKGGGIRIEEGARNVTIGGVTADLENVIGGSIHVLGQETNRIRILRNVMGISEEEAADQVFSVPIDLGGDGPTCALWDTDQEGRPNLDVPAPRVLNLGPLSVSGIARPSATVVAYRVDAMGTNRSRYWARAVQPIGVAAADAEGIFDLEFDFEQEVGVQVALTTTDSDGNTSELSQVRRPIVYLPGVGGSWIEAGNGDNLFLPAATTDAGVNRRLSRLAMNPDGQTSVSGETVEANGILESLKADVPLIGPVRANLPYGDVLQHLQAAGWVGNEGNVGRSTLDLWRFWYDWRRDPSMIADLLMERIDDLTSNSSSDEVAASCQVDVVTHSNGGMVGSAYVFKHREHSRRHVNRLLMSAAPYLGTPQVFAAHTKGYLFEIETSLRADLDWGSLVTVFQNLPDGYGLLPSRKYSEVIDPSAPAQNDWYLMDLYGNQLRGYDPVFNFMTAGKRDDDLNPLGLARNGAMWTSQQTNLHDVMNDWTKYDGPPQVFRHIGRLANSTTLGWRIDARRFSADALSATTRRQLDDTDVHIFYRETLQPLLGWGDGTVALVSATLGGGETPGGRRVGLQDYSGRDRTWISDFEYFPCTHLGIVAPACNGPTGNALERTVVALKSGSEIVAPLEAGSARRGAKTAELTDENESLYIRADAPIAVHVEDANGSRTGPVPGNSLNRLRYDIRDIGYWAGLTNAVVSLPTTREFTVSIQTAGSDARIETFRGKPEGDDVRTILFDAFDLEDGGTARITLTAGGAALDTPFDLDTDGDGIFESSLAPAADILGTDPGPASPAPTPALVREQITIGDEDPVVTIQIPDPGDAGWSWSLQDVPEWVAVSSESGTAPQEVDITLAASQLDPGLYRDTLTVTMTFESYSSAVSVPVELAIRDILTFFSSITVNPPSAVLFYGDSLRFWAQGFDQHGIPLGFSPSWSATGGSIDDSGLYVAGQTPGVFEVTASDGSGFISGSVEVAIIGAVRTEDESAIPTSYDLAQNYPNPFNPSTIIEFDLPEMQRTRLAVYDLHGRVVRLLVDQSLPAARHSVLFDGGGLPSGVYLVRLETASYSKTRRMLLVK